jgi:ABC-type transport system substrate-binding protein
MHYFNAAENILMDDIPMILLYYGSSFRLMQNRISDFENPILGNYDLSRVKLSKKE